MTMPSLEPSQSLPAERAALEQALNRLLGSEDSSGPTGMILIRFDVSEAAGGPLDDLGETGERLIHAGTERITALLTESDLVMRVGLDEVAVIRPSLVAPAEAEGLARRLRDALGKAFEIDAFDVLCPFDIGVAATLNGDDASDLLRFAEHALADAVVVGRNQVVAFEDTDRELLASDEPGVS